MRTNVLPVLGILGFVITVAQTAQLLDSAASMANPPLGKNPIFSLVSPNPDHPLMRRTPSGGVFRLKGGDLFKLRREEGPEFRYNEITFAISLGPGDVQEMHFRATGTASYLLRLSRMPAVASGLFYRDERGRTTPLIPFAQGEAPWVPPLRRLLCCKLLLSDNQFSLRINDAGPFEFSDDRLGEGSVIFGTLEGKPILDRIAFEANDRGETVIEDEEFESRSHGGLADPWVQRGFALVSWILALLAFSWWIALPGRVPFPRVAGELLGLFAIALPLQAAGWIGICRISPGWIAAAPLWAGMVYGVISLPRLRFSPSGGRPPPDRGGEAIPASGGGHPPPQPRPGPARAGALAGLAVLLLAATAPVLLREIDWKVDAPSPPAPEDKGGPGETLRFPGPFQLDLSNVWSYRQRMIRDFTLEGEIRLEADSLAEVYFRSPAGADWSGLQISTLPDTGCRWCEATRASFKQYTSGALGPASAGSWIPFRAEARGCRLWASVGGAALPERLDGSRGRGYLGVRCFKGSCGLRHLEITPHPAVREGMPLLLLAKRAGWLAGLLLCMSAAYTLLLAGGRRLPASRLAVMDALAHLPLAAACLALILGLMQSGTGLAVAIGLTIAGRLAPLAANGPRIGILPLATGTLLSLAAGITAYGALLPPRSEVHRVNNLRLYEFEPPLRGDLLWYQMPKMRRSNSYLQDHAFRDRRFTLAKAPQAFRIACMGSSSTYGHLMPLGSGWDFPTAMESLLKQRDPGRTFEVMNAGIRGGNATVVREYYRGVIRHFKPDLLIVNLFYNDAYVQTLMDEYEYLEELEARSWTQNAFQRLWAEIALLWRTSRFTRYSQAFRDGEPYPKAFFAEGAESFRRLVLDTVRSAREDGVRVLLVKEPFHKGRGILNYKAFYAALDAVGREAGVPVVEPLERLNALFDDLKPLYQDAVHFTRKGNAVMARILVDACAELGLLER